MNSKICSSGPNSFMRERCMCAYLSGYHNICLIKTKTHIQHLDGKCCAKSTKSFFFKGPTVALYFYSCMHKLDRLFKDIIVNTKV